MTRIATLLLTVSALPAAVHAQATTDRDSSIAQISTASSVPPPAAQEQASAEAPDQLGSSNESSSPTDQLSGTAASSAPTRQVSTAPRDARPPQPLSRPSEGRTAAVEAVRGKDRCDAARADQNRKCADVIENRAAQFSRREAPVLSPEQKLLADQQTRESAADFEQAARRLAKSGQTDNSLESLGVASVVLSSPGEPPKKEENPDDPAQGEAAQALINAIVNGGTTTAPQ